jgi:Na+/proline symporter
MFGLNILDIAVVGAYLVLMAIIGLLSSRLIKKQRDFFMGGRRFGKFLSIFMSFGAGVESDHVVIVSGKAYESGMSGIWYQWLYLFCTPFYWLIQPVWRRMRFITMADFFEQRFSRKLATFYTAVGLVILSVNIGLVLLGTGKIVNAISGGQIPTYFVIMVVTAIVIFYSVVGGLIAAAYTDVFQGILIFVLSFLLIPFLLNAVGGMNGLHSKVAEGMFNLTMPGDIGIFFIAVITVNALIGQFAAPHNMTSGASRAETEARLRVTAALMKRICTVGWAFIGVICVALYPHAEHGEMVFGMAVRDYLPVGLIGLMIAAMLAAAMATANMFMLVASALFTKNIYAVYISPDRTDKHLLMVGRIAAFGVTIGGMLFAYFCPTVRGGLEFFWKITATMGIPAMIAIIWPRASTKAAWSSVVGAIIIWILTAFYFKWAVVGPTLCGWLGLAAPACSASQETMWQMLSYLAAGLSLMIIVSWISPAARSEHIEDFYRRLRTPVGTNAELDAL